MFLRLSRKRMPHHSWRELQDEELVAGYLNNGDKEMIALLFERYTHLVYGICLNYLPDSDQCKDAVMEIFESLFHKLTEHRIQNFRNWLYTVTKNHCLMHLRKTGTMNRMKNHISEQKPDQDHDPDSDPEDDLIYSKTQIQTAVESLNPEQSACIRLMYLEDKSYREISDLTGYSFNEVKSHIQNGKRNLKNYLLRQNGTN